MSIKVFISYAHADQELHNKLRDHLSSLERLGEITIWQDQKIPPGADWQDQINTHLNEADLILLLVSASFIASNYCWNKELQTALQRYKAETARVIPIILRPTDWEHPPLGDLQALPTGGNPVTQWNDPDEAFDDIARSIRQVVETLNQSSPQEDTKDPLRKKPSITRRVFLVIAASSLISAIVAGFRLTFQRSAQLTSQTGTTLYTYTGHSAGIEAVKWSPDGTRLASASDDYTVHVWDAFSGKHVLQYRKHKAYVHAVSWSPDGTRLASASGNQVHVWDASKGNLLFIYDKHTDGVHDVAWSPDGTRLASASFDYTVHVWDAISGAQFLTYNNHKGWVTSIAWSPDSQFLASGSYDRTVQIWNATTASQQFVPWILDREIEAVAWSPRGNYIAASGQNQKVSIWDAHQGSHLFLYSHPANVRQIAWSPNEQYISSGCADTKVYIWQLSLNKYIYTYNRHTAGIVGLDWSPNGKYIASGSFDDIVCVWVTI